MSISKLNALLAASLLAASFQASAQNDATSEQDFQALEAEARAIKSEVLDLEAEISALEKQVRYPAHSRWTVFVTSSESASSALQRLELIVDGRVVASHEYSEIEQKSLGNGGAHRLFLGNLNPGEHPVAVNYVADNNTSGDATFTLNKPPSARLLELRWQPDADGAQPLAHNSIADTP